MIFQLLGSSSIDSAISSESFSRAEVSICWATRLAAYISNVRQVLAIAL